MDKRKKKSSQKQFMRTMIITGVLGITIMMFATLYMIKLFSPKKLEAQIDQPPSIVKEQNDVESKEVTGVIHHIGSSNKNIDLWEIKEGKNIKIKVENKTLIQDSYGRPMSIQEMQIGEIVEVNYELKSKALVKIQKSAMAWERRDIINPEIRDRTKTLIVGNTSYDYNNDLMVINENLERVDITGIDKSDTLTIRGLENTVWSIQVLKSASYIELSNLPKKEGFLEIGNNTIYRLEEIEEKISLPAGDHKIVVRIKGYEPFSETIRVSTGETYPIDLKDVKESTTSLSVKVVNVLTDYQVEIDNKTYKKGEVIEVRPGEYILRLRAEGFKLVEMELDLEEGQREINVRLEPKPEEPEPEGPEPGVGPSKPDQPEESRPVQIIIETDPIDAQVFVGGVYKGTSPALTGLKPGEYSISIEKEGYSTLYSTIVIDASNAQKGFLYTLQKN